MKYITTLTAILLIMIVSAGAQDNLQADNASAQTQIPEANVWTTADGTKYFTCPVMGGEAEVKDAEGYSDLEGKRYYHCCPPCQGPFRADPDKWLAELNLPTGIVRIDDKGLKIFSDPISGDSAQVNDKTYHFEKDGKQYYFVSKKNMKKFKKSMK